MSSFLRSGGGAELGGQRGGRHRPGVGAGGRDHKAGTAAAGGCSMGRPPWATQDPPWATHGHLWARYPAHGGWQSLLVEYVSILAMGPLPGVPSTRSWSHPEPGLCSRSLSQSRSQSRSCPAPSVLTFPRPRTRCEPASEPPLGLCQHPRHCFLDPSASPSLNPAPGGGFFCPIGVSPAPWGGCLLSPLPRLWWPLCNCHPSTLLSPCSCICLVASFQVIVHRLWVHANVFKPQRPFPSPL